MQRRGFFRNSSLALLGTTLTGHQALNNGTGSNFPKTHIIFLVNDGPLWNIPQTMLSWLLTVPEMNY
ncbi:hypothetical protein EV199_0295 [Pseudobacter ginsenosidimutans]|uniref:Uncharacterized protein n=1 Tax=Pseudobacter ginsenosidimutans TaxID=661488 RepID=A0A4Q7MYW6_9BACT|nr:hypothetical protein EV199_0295 [Pseudobacter ginsenosidimutans]